jgi:hypothetical protein
MTTKLYELEDRIITDKGEVIAKYELLVKKAQSGEVFTDLPAVPHPDIERYNLRCPDNAISLWIDTGDDTLEGPDIETHQWTIPDKYLDLDITELCSTALIAKGLVTNEYIDRMSWELRRMEERSMLPFIGCLVYITEQFKKNNVVWGIGRGSSCASLVLFLLDINRVDPCKYGIPAEEFFK